MDDRPGQNPHFAGAATAGAAPERHLDAGALQTVQQMLGRADLDRLARAFANRLEGGIVLPRPGAEAPCWSGCRACAQYNTSAPSP